MAVRGLFMNISALLLLWCNVRAMDNLRVVYEWKILDFEFPNEGVEFSQLVNRTYKQENNLPLGLEVYGDRLFVTVPRWKSGVAASLTYINLTETANEKSPKLRPYPNWDAHDLTKTPEIISPFRIRADKCARLWVLDTGEEINLDGTPFVHKRTTLLIYDLNTDTLLRKYDLPEEQSKPNNSFFVNIAVEDEDCDNSYAYLGDLSSPALVVYSWKTNTSWRITHKYFEIDETAKVLNVSGQYFEWTDGLFGLALSQPDSEGYPTLYFHPMISFEEYSINTKYLRDPETAQQNQDKFKRLGSRGPKSQSGASFYDKKTNVLFYTLLNLNAVACWRSNSSGYTMESQGRVFMNNVTMVFPNDIKVDANDNLWVLSDRLPTFMESTLDYKDVNFRILSAPVKDAIRGTACDSILVTKSSTTSPKTIQQKSSGNLLHSSIILIVTMAILKNYM